MPLLGREVSASGTTDTAAAAVEVGVVVDVRFDLHLAANIVGDLRRTVLSDAIP